MLLRTLLRHGLPLLTAAASVLADDAELPTDPVDAPQGEPDQDPARYVVEKVTALIIDQDDTA